MRGELRRWLRLWRRRLYVGARTEQTIIRDFHVLYHQLGKLNETTWTRTRWMGRRCAQCPFDLWALQDLVWQVRPDWIVETGTGDGGTALFLAELCYLMGHGRVITIDTVAPSPRLRHPLIKGFEGDSVDAHVIARVTRWVDGPAVVILDADHRAAHVAAELAAYTPLVPVGSYAVVCDTHFNGHPVDPDFGPGPAEAVDDFLASHPGWMRDRSWEWSLLTFNPGGYLKRVV